MLTTLSITDIQAAAPAAEDKVIKLPDATYMYVQRDTCDLFLDVYNPAPGSERTFQGREKPAIIFMFGGGFIQGTRDDESYHKWFKQLTDRLHWKILCMIFSCMLWLTVACLFLSRILGSSC